MRKSVPLLSLFVLFILAGCGGEAEVLSEPEVNVASAQGDVTAGDPDPLLDEAGQGKDNDHSEALSKLESELEQIRKLLKIPGLAAGVVKDQELIWAKGFGYADVDEGIPVTAETPFHLASVTKPIAATVLMQLLEEGFIDLDDPVAKYGVQLEAQGEVLVRHLLTHTSEGVPGGKFKYSGDRYGYLGEIAQAATGKTFSELMGERLLEPLKMAHSAPNFGLCGPNGEFSWLEGDGPRDGYGQVYDALAKPYMLDQEYQLAGGSYSNIFNPAAGLVASVRDLAAFDIALDQDRLLKPETKALMLEPVISTKAGSEEHQYALGWYIQEYEGTRLEWHTGRWAPSVSALYLKLPEQNITFFALANTPNLTTPFPAGVGEVMYSTVALTFYRYLVFPKIYEGVELPELDYDKPAAELVEQLDQVSDQVARRFLARELWSYRMAYYSVGRQDDVYRLAQVRLEALSDVGLLNGHLASAADRPMNGEVVSLSPDELAIFEGRYTLIDAGLFPDGEGPPAEVTVRVDGQGLVGCAPNQSPLFLIPTGPNSFVTSGGPAGYMAVEIGPGADGQDEITIWLTEQTALIYRQVGD